MSNPYGNLPGVMGEFAEIPFVYRRICDPTPPPVMTRRVSDSAGEWFEFGFTAPEELTGNAATGWTNAAGEISWEIEASETLTTWAEDEMVDAAVTGIEHVNGTVTYWSRWTVPRLWKYVMIDVTAGSDRYGKSITAISLFQTEVSLPNYPYAMPSQAAALQTDLRAAGYTGALVTTTSGTFTAKVRNHLSDGTRMVLAVTMSGANVTVVSSEGSAISLPSYPYAMPSSRATLQTDLRAAGYAGAVVMLYQDPWEILLPDLETELGNRGFTLTITPADPYPFWDFFGVYQGDNPATVVAGAPSNTRSPAGTPLREAVRGFFRIKRTSLPI
jgi:hypothetical protein